MTKAPKQPPVPRKPQDRTGKLEDDPRFAKFAELYVGGIDGAQPGNAYRSAILAGYTPQYAKSKATLLASRLSLSMQEALNAVKMDKLSLAIRLAKKLDAKRSVWHPGQEKFVQFIDHSTQTDALRMSLSIHGAFPSGRTPNKDGSMDGGVTHIHLHTSIQRPPITKAK